MSRYTTFPTGAHNDLAFIDYATKIGRAYRNQAIGLIDICRHFNIVALAPQHAHQDDDLRRYNQPRFLTDEANQRFKEATQVLSKYAERWHPCCQGRPSFIDERMKMTKLQDETIPTTCPYTTPPLLSTAVPHLQGAGDYRGPLTTTKFVLLRSPLASVRDPETVIVHRKHRVIVDCFTQLSHSCIRGTQYQLVPFRNFMEL
ncbi:hypothetical protein EI94DRAFT_1723906 [Lactarius quietus]|nr:hypothetical protein EI94DRAFT_1723906 [Lactarius quietus]